MEAGAGCSPVGTWSRRVEKEEEAFEPGEQDRSQKQGLHEPSDDPGEACGGEPPGGLGGRSFLDVKVYIEDPLVGLVRGRNGGADHEAQED